MYRDHLLAEGYSAATVSGHLSTVRARIRQLNTVALRQSLYERVPDGTPPADAKAFVDETLERLRLNMDPAHSEVKQATVQDTEDSAHVRLTVAQCDELVSAPGIDTLPGMRDSALLALILATGIREAEAVALVVEDLRQTFGNELSLRITSGKGKKKRLVPYGDNLFVLRIVDAWLARAGIESGRVFRGFYKTPIDRQTGHPLPPKVRRSLSVRAVQSILERYPVTGEDGQPVRVRPHDLRRTYARRQYEMGVPVVEIQQNLGHSSQQTTLGYIGTLDATARRGKRMFTFADMGRLRECTLE
jgi:integrase